MNHHFILGFPRSRSSYLAQAVGATPSNFDDLLPWLRKGQEIGIDASLLLQGGIYHTMWGVRDRTWETGQGTIQSGWEPFVDAASWLLKEYPEATVSFVLRDEDQWSKATFGTFSSLWSGKYTKCHGCFYTQWRGYGKAAAMMAEASPSRVRVLSEEDFAYPARLAKLFDVKEPEVRERLGQDYQRTSVLASARPSAPILDDHPAFLTPGYRVEKDQTTIQREEQFQKARPYRLETPPEVEPYHGITFDEAIVFVGQTSEYLRMILRSWWANHLKVYGTPVVLIGVEKPEWLDESISTAKIMFIQVEKEDALTTWGILSQLADDALVVAGDVYLVAPETREALSEIQKNERLDTQVASLVFSNVMEEQALGEVALALDRRGFRESFRFGGESPWRMNKTGIRDTVSSFAGKTHQAMASYYFNLTIGTSGVREEFPESDLKLSSEPTKDWPAAPWEK